MTALYGSRNPFSNQVNSLSNMVKEANESIKVVIPSQIRSIHSGFQSTQVGC